MQAWQAGFEAVQPDVTVNYDPVGSGGGREQFIAGGVDFAGSDAALDDEELDRRRGALRRVGHLRAAQLHLADRRRLQPRGRRRAEPGAGDDRGHLHRRRSPPGTTRPSPRTTRTPTLPDTAITPVHRGDDSGTTDNFTDYLSAAAGDVWTYEPDGEWPLEGGEAAQGTSGVVAAVDAPAPARSATPTSARPATSASPTSRSARSSSRRPPEAAAAVVEGSGAGRRARRVRLRHRGQPGDRRSPASTRSCWSATTSAASSTTTRRPPTW